MVLVIVSVNKACKGAMAGTVTDILSEAGAGALAGAGAGAGAGGLGLGSGLVWELRLRL